MGGQSTLDKAFETLVQFWNSSQFHRGLFHMQIPDGKKKYNCIFTGDCGIVSFPLYLFYFCPLLLSWRIEGTGFGHLLNRWFVECLIVRWCFLSKPIPFTPGIGALVCWIVGSGCWLVRVHFGNDHSLIFSAYHAWFYPNLFFHIINFLFSLSRLLYCFVSFCSLFQVLHWYIQLVWKLYQLSLCVHDGIWLGKYRC